MDQISTTTNWSPLLFTIEVGVRGFVAHSLEHTLLGLGISRWILSKSCKNVSVFDLVFLDGSSQKVAKIYP